jgi:conjugative transfer signal peptidase TraF
MTAVSTAGTAPRHRSHTRSRRRARIVLAGLAVCGLAALAWASFVHSLPRLTYNPSDSVAVGWYRVDPLDPPDPPDPPDPRTGSLPRSLSVGSIVLIRLPANAAALAAQRGYLPMRVPLLKRVGAIAPQEVCIAGGSVRIDGVPSAAVLPADRLGRPLPSWPQCRQLQPGELFLLSVTNPASFDSRYFGPVSASAVIGVAHPVWLENRP